jgi:hypothetical protein
MAVALKLMDEFEGHSLTVLRLVAEVADDHPGCDPSLLERAARTRLIAFIRGESDSTNDRDVQLGLPPAMPVPRQKEVS